MRKWVVVGSAVVALLIAAAAWAISNPVIASNTTSGTAGEESAGPGRGQSRHADSVAAAFGIDAEKALALHEDGVGWGAMVKLLAIAEVKGVSVDQLLAGVSKVDGEYEFDFGQLRAGLTAEQQEQLDLMPRGLGHLKKGNWIPPGQAKKLESSDGS
jgi:hypothetical protein